MSARVYCGPQFLLPLYQICPFESGEPSQSINALAFVVDYVQGRVFGGSGIPLAAGNLTEMEQEMALRVSLITHAQDNLGTDWRSDPNVQFDQGLILEAIRKQLPHIPSDKPLDYIYLSQTFVQDHLGPLVPNSPLLTLAQKCKSAWAKLLCSCLELIPRILINLTLRAGISVHRLWNPAQAELSRLRMSINQGDAWRECQRNFMRILGGY